MKKQSKIIGVFFVLFFFKVSICQAGYLILKTVPCAKSDPCLVSLDESDDPHKDALYRILLDYSWPTAQLNSHYDTHFSEEKNLDLALKKDHLENYVFEWFPDTLEDLSCASALVKSHIQTGKLMTLKGDRGKPTLQVYEDYFYKTNKSFNLQTTDQISELSRLPEVNKESIVNYFKKVNELGKDAFFICNAALSKRIGELIHEQKKEPTRANFAQEVLVPGLKKLRAELAKTYSKQIDKINDPDHSCPA